MASRRLTLIAALVCPLVSAIIRITSPTAASTWTQGQNQMLTWTSDPGDPVLGVNIWPEGGGDGLSFPGNPNGTANHFQLAVYANIPPGSWYFSIVAQSNDTVLATSAMFQILPPLTTTSTKSFFSTSSGTALPTSSTSSSAFSGSSSPSSTAASSGASHSPSNTTVPKSTSHTGAIAGGVVGGIAALMIIAFIAYLFTRQRQKRSGRQLGGSLLPADGTSYRDTPPSSATAMNSEILPMGDASQSWKPYNYNDPSTWPDSVVHQPDTALRHSTGIPLGSDGRPLPEPM